MKIDLTDLTITIPVRYDTEDRVENLKFVIEFIHNYFDTNIMVLEESKEKKFDWVDAEYIHIETNDPNLHRTKCLNDMAKLCKTPYIANYDTDVIFNDSAYVKTMELLREGIADMVYPYAGKFVNIPHKYVDIIRKNNYSLSCIHHKDKHINHPQSLGGAIFWNLESFKRIGMENQKFKSWGWEDNERFIRAKKFDLKIKRVEGELLHLDHKRLEDSTPKNKYYKINQQEFQRISNMSKDNLRKYVKTWEWCK